MKWEKPDGGVQHTSDGRYCVMRATTEPEIWVAYAFSAFGTTADKVGEPLPSIEAARRCCELHEEQFVLRRRA